MSGGARAQEVLDVNDLNRDTPSFLTIGHAARDLVPGGWRWGGTVTYAAMLARAWGIPAAVLTSLAPEDVSGYQDFVGDDVLLHALPSPSSTAFENIYTDAGRQQHVHAQAAQIERRHVPAAWRNAPIVLVGPLLGEVSTRFGGYFSQDSLVAMAIQGRLRSHRHGRIYARRWRHAAQEFSAYDVLFFSEEDVRGNAALAESYAALAPLAVMTQDRRGATVFQHGRASHHAAFPSQPLDMTGAGDVFAAAFLLHYAENRDPAAACRCANAAAACSIEHVGASGIPSREEVRERLRTAES